jgi:aspartyl-tRNA(Asn)/glutamyl-tRNA(Gln) amidotransferase subunit A
MLSQSISELRAGLDRGLYSATELVRESLRRVHAGQQQLNAFITIDDEAALAAADRADAQIAAGSAGSLTGIPIAHKDIFCTHGTRTTCGSRMLADFVPPYESTATARLAQAGAISVGKTNMDEFAMGSSSEHSYFGPVRNPWDQERVPGGSSGGSAAAVAAGLVSGATGTDTGGSIRQPAALCGVTGIKPTYGRVSRWGMIAYASSLDQGGVFGRSAEDCAWLLQEMAGFDPLDSTSLEREVPDYRAALSLPLDGLRIGLPDEYWDQGIDDRVIARVMEAVKVLQQHGASVHPISLQHAALAVPAYYIVAPAECSSNLARFDGVRYGHRCSEPKDLNDLYCRSRAEGFGEEVKRRILVGTYALSTGYYDAYYLSAQKARRLIADDFASAFEKVDLVMAPTTPTPAFKLGEKQADPIAMYMADVNTVGVNLAGLPGLSAPAGLVDGLPVGLQMIANHFEEPRLLAAAHALQQLTDWHLARPTEAGQ